MFVIQFFAKLLKILRSAASPGQIAGGFVLGMIIGLTPVMSLHNLIVLLLIVVLNVNMAMAIFSFGVFSAVAYLADPLFHSFGYFLLADLTSMKGFYTTLYNIPVIALSRFNNTVVMGSLVSSLILLVPVYLLTIKGVVFYRKNIDPQFQKWKIVKVVKGSKFYSIYEKVKVWGE